MPNGPASLHIVRAALNDLDRLVPLFEAYREFYQRPSDTEAARRFLSDRLTRQESVVFLAEDEKATLGFVQLYPTFASTSMRPWWILNDLYVVPTVRRRGVGSGLLARAKQLARETGAEGIGLDTARDNPAQRLYEQLGWRRDQVYLHYEHFV